MKLLPYIFSQYIVEHSSIRAKLVDFFIVGKYAYIGVKFGHKIGHDITVNFKNVPLGATYEKTVEVINYTPVSS